MSSTLYDARNRIKTLTDTYYTASNVTKSDDTTTASVITCWSGSTVPLRRIFDDKNVDGIYAILDPKSTAITDYSGDIIGYHEIVPVQIQCIDKHGIKGSLMRWKMERELRYILEKHPRGSYYSIETLEPKDDPMGRWTLYTMQCNITYERDISPAYSSAVSISQPGHGWLEDFQTIYGDTIYTVTTGGDATHTVCTGLNKGGLNDYWNGRFFKVLTGALAGTSIYVSDFDDATDTMTHSDLGGTIATGSTFVMSDWALTQDGNVSIGATQANDYFDIQVYSTGGNAVSYYSYPSEATNHDEALSLSTSVYTTLVYRYKVSGSTTAKIVAVFSDTTTQTILDAGAATTFTAATATLTTGKTLDHIRFYANGGTGHAIYDFGLICKGMWTFPNFRYGFTPHMPTKDSIQDIPGFDGDPTQGLGSKLWYAECECDLTKGDWDRAADALLGEILLEITAKSGSEQWQWLSITGMEHLKVRVNNLSLPREASPNQLDWRASFTLREVRNSSGSNSYETYDTRLGI